MEEVWKDITALSPSPYPKHLPTTEVAHHQSSVHDFLGSPIYPPTQRCDPKNVSDHIRLSQQVYGHTHDLLTLSSVFEFSDILPLCSQKRDSDNDNGCGDRRYKRKMKNRESATRSRARRQAYTNELELEVAHLRVENAMLRKQQEEMSSADAAVATVTQIPKKATLLRSLTAPF